MSTPFRSSLLLLVCLFLGRCIFFVLKQKDKVTEPLSVAREKADKLLFPNEHFYMQRAYPNFDLSVKDIESAWQKAKDFDNLQRAEKALQAGFEANWRVEGPGNIGGRINTIAVQPNDNDVIYVGCSRGGVFKSFDAGSTWMPIFDDQLFLSIGDIAIDPQNPQTVYVGTGDLNISSHFSVGNGLYRTTDGGQTWTNLGLANARIISEIIIHPQNSNRIFVSTMGNPMERNEDRGLYRTNDGGATWQKVLFVDDDAGIIDLLINPQNPDVLYAASWNRIRNNTETITSEEDSKIWKTSDGGNTWTELDNGLPGNHFSRIGLAMSAQNPNKIAALYIDPDVEDVFNIFVSENAGNDWQPLNANNPPPQVLGNFGWYFGRIEFDPTNDQTLYLLGVNLHRTTDGGETWELAGPEWWEYSVHADKHDLVFANNGQTLLLATDGGLYRSNDDSETWEDIENLPNTQFYRVAINPHWPGTYYGGAQDNGSTGGNANGFNDWPRIYGGDGFQMVFHPDDPNIFFAEMQFGSIAATTDGGMSWMDFDNGVDTEDRVNWDMPYMMSADNPDLMYRSTYRVYKNEFGVDPYWEPISDDLTDGNIFGSRFHTISTLSESPVNTNYLYAGTSDGNVWRSTDKGATWINSNIPNGDRYVTSLVASPNIPERVYATLSGYKGSGNEDLAHVFRSDNNGITWVNISGDLPSVGVNDVLLLAGDALERNLFVATDIGIYASTDGGTNWQRLGTGMPYVATFDIAHSPADNRLVAGTFARSMMSFPLDSLNIDVPIGVQETGTTQQIADLTLSLNQNSTGNELSVSIGGMKPNVGVQISLFDILGKEVFSTTTQHAHSALSLPDLPQGVYLVAARQGNRHAVQKVQFIGF